MFVQKRKKIIIKNWYWGQLWQYCKQEVGIQDAQWLKVANKKQFRLKFGYKKILYCYSVIFTIFIKNCNNNYLKKEK